MALFWSDRGTQRAPSLKGRVIFDVYQGQIRARAWPSKKTKPRPQRNLDQEEWFRQANLLDRYAAPADRAVRRRATQGTVFMPRDLLLKALRGYIIEPIDDNGTIYRSAAVRAQVTEALDYLSDVPGSLAYRSPDGWRHIPPGNNRQVLTLIGSEPQWIDPPEGGGGGSTSQVDPSRYVTPINMDGVQSVITTDNLFGIVYAERSPGTRLHAVTFQPPAQPFTYTIALQSVFYASQGSGAGIAIFSGANDRAVLFGATNDNIAELQKVKIIKYNDPVDFDTTDLGRDTPHIIDPVLQITIQNDEIVFSIGPHPELLSEWHRDTLSNLQVTPNFIGLGLTDNGEADNRGGVVLTYDSLGT